MYAYICAAIDNVCLFVFHMCWFFLDLKHFESSDHGFKIGSKEVSITNYHPVLATFEEADELLSSNTTDEEPPPIPSRNYESLTEHIYADPIKKREEPPPIPSRNYEPLTEHIYANPIKMREQPPPIPSRKFDVPPLTEHIYQNPPYRLKMNDAMSNYMMYKLTQINQDLIKVHGEARIEGKQLEVRPLERAKEIANWNQKVEEIVKKHKSDFQSATIPLNDVSKASVLEFLYRYQQKHGDFHFLIEEREYRISGGSRSVTEALEHINNMLEEEVEVTRELEKPPHLIDYFMKFGKEEMDAVQPPVKITRSQEKPGLVIVRGVKQSLDKIEAIAHEKMSHLNTEYVPLTRQAHNLLAGGGGKHKLAARLGSSLKDIQYTFEIIEAREEFTHQVCIVSSNASSLAVSKKIFENLCKEEKIFLPQDRRDLTSSSDWERLIESLGKELFASVRTTSDMITITGDESDIKKVVADIRRFLDTQDEGSEEMSVSGPVWQVIHSQLKDKLDRVCKEARRNKVHVNLPVVDEDRPSAFIHLQGNRQHIENVKVQLSHLVDEVHSKSFSIPPKAGLHRLAEKGSLRTKCHDLARTNKVVVRYEVEADPSLNALLHDQRNKLNAPRRIVSATSPLGVRVSLFTGNYARQKCDVIVTFIPESLKFTEPVLVTLGNVGGRDVQNDLEASLGSQKLICASFYRTQHTGDIKCREIFHIVLPKVDYSSTSDLGYQKNALNKTLQKVFDDATSYGYDTIVLCPLTVPPLNYPVDLYAQTLASTILSIKSGTSSGDLSVQVFVENECESDDFELAMTHCHFHIHDRSRSSDIPEYRPTVTKKHGTTDSLKQVVHIGSGNMLDLQVCVCRNKWVNNETISCNFNLTKQFRVCF